MDLLDLLRGNTQPGGAAGMIDRSTPQTGLAALLQQAQNPGAMAMSGPQPPPQQPMGEQQRQMPGAMPPAMGQPHKGIGWRGILGAFGDGLTAAGGGTPIYGPAMLRQREQDREQQLSDQQYQRKRTDDNTDWQTHKQWEQANPDTPSGIREFEQFQQMTPEEQVAYLQMKQASAPRLVTDPQTGAQGYVTPPPSGGAMGGGAPPVGTVKNGFRFLGGNHRDRNSWVPAGGAGPSGPQTFR